MGVLTIATWNTQWRMPGSKDAELIVARLKATSPDIICLTEACADLPGNEGHVIACDPDHGYPVIPGRHKVLLWSREPWVEVDPLGHADLPPGRFIAGRTLTPAGPLQVIGLCIPWRGAHVQTGRRDRAFWQDHLLYLSALRQHLDHTRGPALLIGDFNQRVPRRYTPPHVHAALHAALGDRFRIATAGPIAPLDRLAIDHVAHTSELAPLRIRALSNLSPQGRPISDHFGVVVQLGRTGEACR
ncbi:hypothetical protein BSL82_08425 [Tardibacter chloracetimidivorans]|uniref:Endonuclease/exonuclease/phosphatase domain-containing protein n=1 Tax=Tardibacter chloracetimidivorans TaxID=1921510 RepID=A0A1L3ZUL7_9SPHN|nr:endonuclease/exonuclease/phosphatase family protein [Tardibacter chloracetimidivorans]API59332.1 hypothetical protein BSL82_08425 [Tardibacter chloracetimidivorans]